MINRSIYNKLIKGGNNHETSQQINSSYIII